MISYNEKERIFHIYNKKISYYMHVNFEGAVETLYFGKFLPSLYNIDAIRKGDIDNNSSQYFDMNLEREFTHPDIYKEGIARNEISSHGGRDKRGAPIIISQKNGAFETDFRYFSFEIVEGLPVYSDIPYVRENGVKATTLRICYKERRRAVLVYENITILEDKDIVIKNFEIVNKSNEIVPITRAFSMQLDLPDNQYKIHHFPGRWAYEREHRVNDLVEGVQEVFSNKGRSSHEENPFVFLSENEATNTYGRVIGFNLVYSGNFMFRTYTDMLMGCHILYGIGDEDFRWMLNPKETFITPQAVIAYSEEGIDKMSQEFHSLIKEHIVPPEIDKIKKPLLFNSWEGCTFTFNTESMLSYVDDSTKIGSELFVLDDGWFGKRDDDTSGLGDWVLNENKINLQAVIDRCHKHGMKFGIWFEPEMVNPDSDLYRDYPQYALGDRKLPLTPHRHQFLLDFANQEVVDNIFHQMELILDKYPIDYIKWDNNRVTNEHFSNALDAEHQGEVYHRLMLGYYNLISRLRKKYPNIFFEGCASGGGRFDLGTLFYCPQIWASDETDPICRMFIQYNTSIGYPLSTIGSHVSNSKMTCYKTKAILALFGTYGLEMNPNVLTESEIEELCEIGDVYRKYHQEVIGNGTLYHLKSPQETNAMCMQSVSKDKSKSIVIYMNKFKEQQQYRFIKLKGLDEEKLYRNSLDNEVFSGAYYQEVGLNLSRKVLYEFDCELIILEEVGGEI